MINKLTGDVTTLQGAGSQPATIAAGAVSFGKITPGTIRELLTADRTYFVRTDGSDANNGLTNNAAGAFLTIQKAVDTAAALDCSIFNLTIQCNDGTRTLPVALRTMLGSGVFTLLGNIATPANCVISTTSADAISAINIYTTWVINGFKVQTATSGYGLRSQGFGSAIQYSNIDFGACATAHILCLTAFIGQFSASCTISGPAPIFAQILRLGSYSMFGGTLVITGTPAFSSSFVQCDSLSLAIFAAATFTGSATGSRYAVSQNAVIQTSTGSITFLPGSAVGTVATGGQYS